MYETPHSRRKDPLPQANPPATPHQTAAPQTRAPTFADQRRLNMQTGRQRASPPPTAASGSPTKEIRESVHTEQAASPGKPEYPPKRDPRKSHAALRQPAPAPSPRSSPLHTPHSNKARESQP